MPINKVTVGNAKGPNIKNVKSKIGSLNNVRHKPGIYLFIFNVCLYQE